MILIEKFQRAPLKKPNFYVLYLDDEFMVVYMCKICLGGVFGLREQMAILFSRIQYPDRRKVYEIERVLIKQGLRLLMINVETMGCSPNKQFKQVRNDVNDEFR